MNPKYQVKLELKKVVPWFELISTQDKIINVWDYKQKKNLVILFFQNSDCQSSRKYLLELNAYYNDFIDSKTEIIAITSDSLEKIKKLANEIGIVFPILSDKNGEVINKYTYSNDSGKYSMPSIFITDRFGALYFQQIAEDEKELPSIKEVLDWINFIEKQCPECPFNAWIDENDIQFFLIPSE